MDYKQKTIAAYNDNTDAFICNFRDLLDFEKRFEFRRFQELLQGKKILDAGCGSGEHAAFFKEKGFEVEAIDLSEKMVALTKSLGVPAQIMDIEDMTFKDGAFDGIWAVTSLLHVPKDTIEKVFSDMYNSLKDAGILYVCVKEGSGEGMVSDSQSKSERFYSFWTEDELKEKAKNYFKCIESTQASVGDTVFLKMFFRKR